MSDKLPDVFRLVRIQVAALDEVLEGVDAAGDVFHGCDVLKGNSFDLAGVPAVEISLFGVEIDSNQMNIALVDKVFLKVQFVFYLVEGCWVVVQFEFEEVDCVGGLDHRIDPSIVGT